MPRIFQTSLCAIAIAAAGLAAPPAVAATIHDYDACMALVHERADSALEAALAWEQEGGGSSARHCIAMALAAIGNFGDAADQLEALAWDLPPDTPDTARAQVLAQAGQFWLDAGQPGKADALFSAAVDLAPRDPEIRIDRAMAFAASRRFQDAIVDLSASILMTDNPLEALVLRASAYRQSDRLPEAGEDLERALSLDESHPGALLERGLLRKNAGDAKGARIDWESLLKQHPDSPEAEAARRHLGLVTPSQRTRSRH